MASSIMVLGPSVWTEEDPDRQLEGPPLDIRRELAGMMRRLGSPAIVLEEQDQATGEDNFDLFLRTVNEASVGTFVVFWPLGARLHGLEVEFGYLLTQLSEGALDPDSVYVLAEHRTLSIDQRKGVIAWSEPGNRTRYHEDLVARGCRIRRWSTMAGLRAQIGAIVLEHRLRHGNE